VNPQATVEPDPFQRRALDAIAHGHALVTGAAGTGKSLVAVRAIVEAVERGVAPERVVLIAPTRVAAARLRDRVSLAVNRPTGVPLVRTASSLAFEVLSSAARAANEPAPSLITGAEQDVILKDLLEGRIASGDLDWGGLPPQALRMPAFRDELRAVLQRAAEADLAPVELAELGERAGQPGWVAAAAMYQEYRDVMTLRSLPGDQGQRFDAGSIAARAADALAAWPAGSPPQWDLVVVDDYQDATAATTSLLAQLRRGGARVVLIGNADEAVQGYRGGIAGGLAAAAASGVFPDVVELERDHRQGALGVVSAAVAQRVGVRGVGSARAAVRAATSVGGVDAGGVAADAVDVLVLPHRYAQSRAIAAALRRARHEDAVPWSRMAVIARSRSLLQGLRADLLAADVPCEALGDGTALQHETAVWPLLALLRIAGGEPWTEDLAAEVMQSRIFGLDAVALRRLRRALVAEDRAGGGTAGGGALLADALADPARLSTMSGPEAAAAVRAARAVRAAKERAASAGPTPGAVIWAAWEALGVGEQWRAAALAGSARDDADLDAIIALLRAAQTFEERMPGATVAGFLDYLEGQEFAVDSLGARGSSAECVAFCTPASAAGREWDVVIVAGLEEGVWPDLRLRDSVLGAQRLAEVVADGWDGAASRALPQRDLRQARKDVLDDETRAFLVAVSRARTRLVVTAIEDGDTRPSRYLGVVEAAAGVRRADGVPGAVADLRGAVAALRSARPSPAVATALALLADAGEAAADPATWVGVAQPSSEEPVWDEEAPVTVSPSRIDLITTCPLRWVLESAGGRPASSNAQNTGLLIHEIAAEHPHGGSRELHAALEERLSEGETWVEQRAFRDASAMVDRLAGYLATSSPERVLVEQPFRVELGTTIISGIADRVEIDGDTARVVDLKTGSKITGAQGEDHGQLMLYQLAANRGAFDGVSTASGAALVFVGKGAAKAGSVVRQSPVEDDVALARLNGAEETMRGTRFAAVVNELCPHCPVRRSCPAQPQGDQVGDR